MVFLLVICQFHFSLCMAKRCETITHHWYPANRLCLWTILAWYSMASYVAYLCHCSISALGLWFFIRRGKQCLDFTVTVHFFHMIGCWIYNSHLPSALSWWLVNVACMALMAVIGEYLCMRTELRAIPVNSGPKSNLWLLVGTVLTHLKICRQLTPEEIYQKRRFTAGKGKLKAA